MNSEIRAWTSEMKQLYSENFTKLQFKANPLKSSGGKGTHLVHLYHLLFDLIYNNDNDNDNDNDNANGKLNPAVVYWKRSKNL